MNYQLTQTGEQVQDILNQAPTTEETLQAEITRSTNKDDALELAIGNEKTRAEGVEGNLQTAIGNEVIRAEGAESNLQTAIGNEKTRAELVEGALRTDVDGINAKIPTGASSENKLATESFVNSSISTNTADFKGTFNSLEQLETEVQDANANDYAFVISTDATGNTAYNRYKYVEGTGWVFEYALNNSSFTSAQWAAINSAITAALVAKLTGLPTATELTTQLNAIIDSVATEKSRAEGIESGLRTDVNANATAIGTEKTRAEGVEGNLSTAIGNEKTRAEAAELLLQQNINAEALLRGNADTALQGEIDGIDAKIPTQASASNQLADKAFVNSSIATNTAEFKGTYNSLAELQQVTNADANDYAFVITTDSDGNKVYNRYKYVTGTGWVFEYALNNSSFTAAQWGAINSGITAALAAKINGLPDIDALNAMFAAITSKIPADASSLNKLVDYAQLVYALSSKQDTLIFDNVPTENSNNPVKSGGIYQSIATITAAIVGLQSSKQDVLTFDQYPTPGSNNPVRSGGINTWVGNQLEPVEIRVSTNESDIANLQAAYRALTESDVVVVGQSDTWPVANPQLNTIYRVSDRAHTPPQNYSDYMYNGTAMVLMATYDNAIDDEPTAGSNNLVKSGGVFVFFQNTNFPSVFWRNGKIEINKTKLTRPFYEITLRVLENCLFIANGKYISVPASSEMLSLSVSTVVFVMVNSSGQIILRERPNLVDCFCLFVMPIQPFTISGGLFHFNEFIAAIKPSRLAIVKFNGVEKYANYWAWKDDPKILNTDFEESVQNIYNIKRIGTIKFVSTIDMTTRANSAYLDLVVGKTYIINPRTQGTNYLYQVNDSGSSQISGGYTNKVFKFVPESGKNYFIYLKKSDNSDFTGQEIIDITEKGLFEIYEDSPVYPINGFLDTKKKVNLWGTTEITDGYYINSVTGNLVQNNVMCCSKVPVVPSSVIYLNFNYLHYAFFDKNDNYISGGSFNYQANIKTQPVLSADVPLNAVKMGLSTRKEEKETAVATELHFPNKQTAENYFCSRDIVPQTQVLKQRINKIYDKSAFFNSIDYGMLSGTGTVTISNNKVQIDSNSSVRVNNLYTTLDRMKAGANVKILTIPSSGYIFRFGVNGSAVASGVIDSDTFVEVYSDVIILYKGVFNSGTPVQIGTASLSVNLSTNDSIQVLLVKDTINRTNVKVFKSDNVIGEISIVSSVDPNDPDHALNQARSWGTPCVMTNVGASLIVERIFQYSDCAEYPRIAVCGDSFVENMSRVDESGWVRLLENQIGTDNIFVAGMGGANTDMLKRRLPIELGLCRPQYLILQVGPNDWASSAETFKANLTELIDMVKSVNAIPILVTIPRRGDVDNLSLIETVNPWIVSLGYLYIDIAMVLSTGDGVTQDTTKFRPDLIHPNSKGAKAIVNWINMNLPQLV